MPRGCRLQPGRWRRKHFVRCLVNSHDQWHDDNSVISGDGHSDDNGNNIIIPYDRRLNGDTPGYRNRECRDTTGKPHQLRYHHGG